MERPHKTIKNIVFNRTMGRDLLINDIEANDKSKSVRRKIAFFVKPGLDSFLGDILQGLSSTFETRKIIVTQYKQIDEGMEWADLAWFEWCDELVIYGSKLELSKRKKVICRLHSYEAFTDYPLAVNWKKVDKLIFVSEQIREYVSEKLHLEQGKTIVIPNGINTGSFTFREREPGFHIAYVGYINYKKGPMLLLHTMKALYDKDQRYQLHIAGQFQDDRDALYYRHMIKEFGIEKNVFFEGWQDNLDAWLEDKNYILCTSILESQNMSVMQAMAKGIKPVIHNFVGAKSIYDGKYLWNTIEDAVHMVEEDAYRSTDYLDFIKDKYTIEKEIEELEKLLQGLELAMEGEGAFVRKKELPLVTIGITNYNGKQYLKQCVESFLNQTYSNLEIILVDDCSTDGSKEIIQEYEKAHDNIRGIYHETNSGGASKGINEIIKNAKGSYFQWIACDDYVQSDAIEEFVNYLEEEPEKDYVYSDFNIKNEEDEQIGAWEYINLEKAAIIQHIFNTGSGLIPMNCLYRKSFFETNQVSWIIYKENDFSADTLNSLHFLKYNWKYGKLNKALINYRIHSKNASHNLEKRMKASIALYDYIIQNFSEEVYLPQIEWKSAANREQLKMLCLAQFYYLQIQNHQSGSAIPEYLKITLTKEQIGMCCGCFAEEGIFYAKQGLLKGDLYQEELDQVKNSLEAFLNDIASASGI